MSEFDRLCANDAELAELRAAVREFLAADRAAYGWQPAVDSWLARWDPDFSARLAEAGFVGLTIPTEFGGRGLGHLHRYVVTEELLAHGAPVAAHWIADRQVAPALLSFGTDEQRRRLLPRIAAGRLYSAIGMSEHTAGSDLAAAQTKAVQTDGGWILNGTKVWTSGAHVAHQIVVLARAAPADPQHRHAGFSQFIVPTDSPGLTIHPIQLMNGEHHFNEVVFEDVFVDDANVLGRIGDGWRQVTAELAFERSGPERILSTATLVFDAIGTLAAAETVDDGTKTKLGDLVGQLISLRQLSISVARTLAAGGDAATRAALVKDLGTRFEQRSVEAVADLIDVLQPLDTRLRELLATARVHSPLFTLRGGTNEVLRGVVAKALSTGTTGDRRAPAELAELAELTDDLGRRSFEERLGRRGYPDAFDDALWARLEDTGLSRLTSAEGAGPAESAVVLAGLARHAAAAPVAETDLLAGWLAGLAGLSVPDRGPLTTAIADAELREGRIVGTAADVPWPHCPVVLAARTTDAVYVAKLDQSAITARHETHNIAGEPRGSIAFDVLVDDAKPVDTAVADELIRRGAWARCNQIIGALETACELASAHTGERVQFGRPLRNFQAVQHSLAAMAGELERARATIDLATAAVIDHGFGSAAAEYAITAAKVAVGRAAEPVTTIAHQLHGAIGVTVEHRLWLSTMRARAWVDEFGSTAHYARRLGASALSAADPWDVVVSGPAPH